MQELTMRVNGCRMEWYTYSRKVSTRERSRALNQRANDTDWEIIKGKVTAGGYLISFEAKCRLRLCIFSCSVKMKFGSAINSSFQWKGVEESVSKQEAREGG
jgi:hypothetical protein